MPITKHRPGVEVLTTAVEAGVHSIGAWARIAQITRTPDGYVSTILLLDSEDSDKRHKVSPRSVETALGKIARGEVDDVLNASLIGNCVLLLAGREDWEIDGPAADVIVQIVIFGKQVYA